jgi:hypothetical protein
MIGVQKMKATITLKLDATLLRKIQAIADEEGTSISALLAARFESKGLRASARTRLDPPTQRA